MADEELPPSSFSARWDTLNLEVVSIREHDPLVAAFYPKRGDGDSG